jgi:thioredoxin reductase (NADPH)
VKRLHMIVRRDLSETMSRYLIERIAALPNVEVHVGAEIAGLEGDEHGLSGAMIRDNASGALRRCDLRHLFLFIGADPNSEWLPERIQRDNRGFVMTGSHAGTGCDLLETGIAGVFAIGDVRAGSTKRVAAAVGEGAAVVAQIHARFAAKGKDAP